MELAPVTSTRLHGRTHDRGKALTVTDTSGDEVVRAVLGEEARPAYAVFQTFGGRCRIEAGARSGLTGVESASVVDWQGNVVARVLSGEIMLAGGESLQWKLSSVLRTRCRVGGDLWVATAGSLFRGGRFRADLSEAMLARADVSFLTGLAAILTRRATEAGQSMTSTASGI